MNGNGSWATLDDDLSSSVRTCATHAMKLEASETVQSRIVKSLSDVFASGQDDATFFPWDGCQSLGLCLPPFLPHPTRRTTT